MYDVTDIDFLATGMAAEACLISSVARKALHIWESQSCAVAKFGVLDVAMQCLSERANSGEIPHQQFPLQRLQPVSPRGHFRSQVLCRDFRNEKYHPEKGGEKFG